MSANKSQPGESDGNRTTGLAVLAHEPKDDDAWDEFVSSHPAGTIYHTSLWRKLIEGQFRKPTYYLRAVDDDGQLQAVLPLVRLKSWYTGDQIISVPYCNYGGCLSLRADAAQLLRRRALTLAKDLGANTLELREIDEPRESDAFSIRTDKVLMKLALPDNVDMLWSDIGSKRRAQIRRPDRENVEILHGGQDLVDSFYAIFARNMRDLGTPVYPRSFFAAIVRLFGQRANIIVVRVHGQLAAACFLMTYNGEVEIPWASSIRDLNRYGVNMRLYWEALKFSIESGCRAFDFGRSTRDQGTYKFKAQWGAQPIQLHWSEWSADGSELASESRESAVMRTAVRAWRKLPLPVANWIGPKITSNLPW